MKYLVTAREVWVQTYEVEADSPESAIRQVRDDASLPETVGEPEYSHTLDPDTWTVEEKPQVVAQTREVGGAAGEYVRSWNLTVRDITEEYDGPTFDLRWEKDGVVYISEAVYESLEAAMNAVQLYAANPSMPPTGFPLEGGREAMGAMRPGTPSWQAAKQEAAADVNYARWERRQMAAHLELLMGRWETRSLELWGDPAGVEELRSLREDIRRLKSLLSFKFSTVEFILAWGDHRWESRDGAFLSDEVVSMTHEELTDTFLSDKQDFENVVVGGALLARELTFCGVLAINLNPDPME